VVNDDVTEELSATDSAPLLSVVFCTAPADKAEAIARAALDKRLAACVNIVPGVTSLYWWEGAVMQGSESLLILKTRTALLDELTNVIRAAHPYELPEVLALPTEPDLGNPVYRAWIALETKRTP
jgi:periplasmic divalent cation tolerance protein